jgi:predicted RNA-binding Zn-ribbon protein involved in translation (DUF1610 family)
MTTRKITAEESRRIGRALGDVFVASGHPLTCNGGNPDWSTHHDREVLMRIDERGLVCPKCGRVQKIPALDAAPVHGPKETPMPTPEAEHQLTQLRQAAAIMRQRAMAANTDAARTPYSDNRLTPVGPAQWPKMVDNYLGGDVGQHCASWTPAVALAVADWLDTGANPYSCVTREPMLAVARAYLDATALDAVVAYPAGQHPNRCSSCGDPITADGTQHVWPGRVGMAGYPYDHPAQQLPGAARPQPTGGEHAFEASASVGPNGLVHIDLCGLIIRYGDGEALFCGRPAADPVHGVAAPEGDTHA